MRADMSAAPAGGNGTISRIGRSGKPAAFAAEPSVASNASAKKLIGASFLGIDMRFLSSRRRWSKKSLL
jgi:hypothetical protein